MTLWVGLLYAKIPVAQYRTLRGPYEAGDSPESAACKRSGGICLDTALFLSNPLGVPSKGPTERVSRRLEVRTTRWFLDDGLWSVGTGNSGLFWVQNWTERFNSDGSAHEWVTDKRDQQQL